MAVGSYRRWIELMQKPPKRRKSPSPASNRAFTQVQALEARLLMSVSVPRMHTTLETIGTHGSSKTAQTFAAPPSSAISPTEMRVYYGIDTIQYGNIPGDGRGMTIAIVDAFDQPNLQSDFNAFNQQYTLPTLTLA